MRVAFATCSALPEGSPDDHAAARLLGADFRAWDDDAVDWFAYDRVVLRSVWDYCSRLEEFLAWCRAVGEGRLRNSPAMVAFNVDKEYLREISAAVVPTSYLRAGDPCPRIDGEVVVKPNVSAGARDTGRFGSTTAAAELIGGIQASGRTALVQPYLASVDARGETSVVFIGGEVSHVLTKRAVLRNHGIAPLAEGRLAPAAAMLDPDLVGPGTADHVQLAVADAVHSEMAARFGTPVYARVDLIAGSDDEPLVSELELIEPRLYLQCSPLASERLAGAVLAS